MRRTKIVCTIGPASRSAEGLEALLLAGMDVARLNMSHETHAAHAAVIRGLRAASKKTGKEVAILMDLCGPKIRVGRMVGGSIDLKPGALITLTTKPVEGTAKIGRAHV